MNSILKIVNLILVIETYMKTTGIILNTFKITARVEWFTRRSWDQPSIPLSENI